MVRIPEWSRASGVALGRILMVMEPKPSARSTSGAIQLSLVAASLLDLATSNALSLTDRAPSSAVLAFQFLDRWATPTALVASGIAGLAWIAGSRRTLLRLLDLSLALALVALVVNLVGLVACLFDKQDNPGFLLLSASLVYLENIAVFASFYWRFDHAHREREGDGSAPHPGVVFPQDTAAFHTLKGWKPGFVDYLFLSFNTASTFGPTLPVPLRAPVQLGMMLQVLVAMAVLVMLAARAVGMIG